MTTPSAGAYTGRAGRGRDVQAVVGAARLPVQNALAAIDAADAAARRPGEAARIIGPCIAAGARRCDHGGFQPDPLQRFGVGRHGLRRQTVHAFDLIFAGGNGQDRSAFVAVCLADPQAALAGFVAVEADHEAAVRGNQNLAAVEA